MLLRKNVTRKMLAPYKQDAHRVLTSARCTHRQCDVDLPPTCHLTAGGLLRTNELTNKQTNKPTYSTDCNTSCISRAPYVKLQMLLLLLLGSCNWPIPWASQLGKYSSRLQSCTLEPFQIFSARFGFYFSYMFCYFCAFFVWFFLPGVSFFVFLRLDFCVFVMFRVWLSVSIHVIAWNDFSPKGHTISWRTCLSVMLR